MGGGGNKFWKCLDGRVLAALSYRCWGARGAGGEINSCFCCCCIVIISCIMWLSCCGSNSLCSLWNWKHIQFFVRVSSISFLWHEVWYSARELIPAASWLKPWLCERKTTLFLCGAATKKVKRIVGRILVKIPISSKNCNNKESNFREKKISLLFFS